MTREEKSKEHYHLTHKIIDDIIYKQCPKCEQWLIESEENFYKRNKSKPELGYVATCKRCSINKRKEYISLNHEKVLKQWHKTMSIGDRKEKHDKQIKRWFNENSKHRKKYVKEYWQSNPDRAKGYQENRQHKNHVVSKQEWEACKEYFNNSCAYCGLPAKQHICKRNGIENVHDLHKEHVDHEGSKYLDNCVPSCVHCNSSKWKHPMEEWYRQQVFFSEERFQKIYKWIKEDNIKYINIQKDSGVTRNDRVRVKKYVRPVSQYSLDGVLLNTYKSIKDAAIYLNIDASAISKCCKGKYKKYKDFIWKYTDTYKNDIL